MLKVCFVTRLSLLNKNLFTMLCFKIKYLDYIGAKNQRLAVNCVIFTFPCEESKIFHTSREKLFLFKSQLSALFVLLNKEPDISHKRPKSMKCNPIPAKSYLKDHFTHVGPLFQNIIILNVSQIKIFQTIWLFLC